MWQKQPDLTRTQGTIKLYWQREGSGPDVAAAGPMPGAVFS